MNVEELNERITRLTNLINMRNIVQGKLEYNERE